MKKFLIALFLIIPQIAHAQYVERAPLLGSSTTPQTVTNLAYAPTDASGKITTGGTFQTVFALNLSRVNCLIENPTTATEVLYVHYTAASATLANSVSLNAGSSFNCAGGNTMATGAISVTAATTGHAFMAAGL
jgi:hypothetical protein